MKSSPLDHAEARQTLNEKLEESGLRATRQRELIYGLLVDHQDHPTADDIFARAKNEMPSISLATVYNCLDTLVQCDLVKQVSVDREPMRFCPNLKEHAHFHDLSSGRVYDIDLDSRTMAQLRRALPDGFDAKSINVTFRGTAIAR